MKNKLYIMLLDVLPLKKKLERSTDSRKEEMILCLMTLIKRGDFEEDLGTAEDWTELVDRGGLWHVCEITFHLFCAMEEVIHMYAVEVTAQTDWFQEKRNHNNHNSE